MTARAKAIVIAALQSSCSLVIGEDATFAEAGMTSCELASAPTYVKPVSIGRSGWFSTVVAADEDLIIAIAPAEADRPPQSGTNDAGFIFDPKDQLPDDLQGSGTIHVFERYAGRWEERSRMRVRDPEWIWPLIPADPLSDDGGPFTYEELIVPAFSVGLHEGTIAIGVPGDPTATFSGFRGSVRLFDRLAGNWEERSEPLEEAELGAGSAYGTALALDAEVLAVGAPGAPIVAAGATEPTTFAGAVYVYRRAGSDYVRIQSLQAPEPQGTALFGARLAMSTEWLIVGAPFDSTGALPDSPGPLGDGMVYAYRRNGVEFGRGERVPLPDQFPRYSYGSSLALLGNTLVVAAPSAPGCSRSNDRAFFGAVHIFEYAGEWVHRLCLEGPHTDFFGWSVALSETTLAVSEPWWDGTEDKRTLKGAVYLFDRRRLGWSGACRLEAPNADPGDSFGLSLALTERFVAVGAPFEDGAGLGLGANPADNRNLDTGALYLFEPVPAR